MRIHDLSGYARRILPSRLFGALRTAGNVVLTPALFSYYTGHARSALRGRAVDRHGAPVPWYTYPANDFLAAQRYEGRDILEFGAGHSTLWWAGRARSVTSFEADADWTAYLSKLVPGNVTLHNARTFDQIDEILQGRRFDLIIVDGPDTPILGRQGCAERAPGWMAKDGGIILDNSEGSWSPDGRFRIMDYFRARGFGRVDFYGWGPANIAPACTSLFFPFGERCFLLCGEGNPIKPYPLSQQE
jgi:hypothetical protein